MATTVMIFFWSNVRNIVVRHLRTLTQMPRKDGFTLEVNKWDSVPVADLLLPIIKSPLKHRLETAGYLG